ncbi:hypothetical protein [Bradyrhizobium ivorense]|uniref:hypothetical protein n=1 Tax=Bradyrhizobium ivorense TaxID=2511166 RepID=UPI0010BB587B|nr:hypothetical protein [Bradyrhizobium ivorense]VIO73854.1 hypothetical protein CI41S_39630 [Bradyrhizobium ivorense]
MTSQQHADNLLSIWQLQRRAGIKPEARQLPPSPADREFERDLAVIRQVMASK